MGWTKRFLILAAITLAALLPAGAQQAPNRVALVIANAAYASANVLTNPVNDATIVTSALRRAGFQTVDAKSNLGIAAFQRALRDFQTKADGAQIALIYYAGHGIEGNGRNWLIPTDAMLNTERDLDYEAINLDLVMTTVQGADLRVVILDACRNNPLGRNWRRGARAVTRGLGGVDADDVLVIYAAAPGETASDGTGVNSPFATALAARLPQPDLPIQLLGGAVRDDVLRMTGGVQRPFVSASITGTPFYLVPRGAGAVDPELERLRRENEALRRAGPPAPTPVVRPPTPHASGAPAVRPGETFRDCSACPEMVAVPGGSYEMLQGLGFTIRTFVIGKYEVTFDEWETCVTEGGCRGYRPEDKGWGRGRHPVINVTWDDAQAYVEWLSTKAATRYRLPTNSEWEYAARAGATGEFPPHLPYVGLSASPAAAVLCESANHNDNSTAWQGHNTACSDGARNTAEVGRYRANAFGLHDMVGNVWEWVADCDALGIGDLPRDGRPYGRPGCDMRTRRGGSWFNVPGRATYEFWMRKKHDNRDDTVGFRVARDTG